MKIDWKQMLMYKKVHVVIIVLIFLLNFSFISITVPCPSSSEITILEERIVRLGTNSTTYVKFQNRTGIYEIKNSITTELESFVEPEWKIQWQDNYQKYQDNLKREKKLKAERENLESIINTALSPLICFFGFLNPLMSTIEESNAFLSTFSTTTEILETINEPIANILESELVKDQNDADLISSPHLNIEKTNKTHIWITDPTNQTDGYYIERGSGYQELNSSRGQNYRHWYNETSGKYHYSSASLVNKTGIVDNTDWVTEDEYPHSFVIRLLNGTIKNFDTPNEISKYISLIDNSTIWAVGYESFNGLMGIYLDFKDTLWGHGQYLYWPRLSNGQILPFDQPMFAMFPHLYVNTSGILYNEIISDRSLYTETYQDPRNALHFYNTSDTCGLYFSTYDVNLFSSDWDFEHGFKFNFTDGLFHQITHMRCHDRDFDDIGISYDITSTPQSDGTPFQFDRFRISNDTYSVMINVSQLWNANDYVDNYFSKIDIISQNNESFTFTFDDMKDTGFTQKYLNLNDQQFPNGITRRTIRAGMYDYGHYSNDTWIEVDPLVDTDVYSDVWWGYRSGSLGYHTSGFDFEVGYHDTYGPYYAWVTFDTGLSTTFPIAIDDTNLSIFIVASQFFSNSIDLRVYQVGSGPGLSSDACTEGSTTWLPGPNNIFQYSVFTDSDIGSVEKEIDTLTDYWTTYRTLDESYIYLQFLPGADCFDDVFTFMTFLSREIENIDPYHPPNLGFEYSQVPTCQIVDEGNSIYAGLEESSVITRFTAPYGFDDIDDCWLEIGADDGSLWDINITYNVDTNQESVILGSEYCIVSDMGDTEETTGGDATGGVGWIEITWKFTLDWDYPHDEDDIDYRIKCDDELGKNSTKLSEIGSGQTFENDLVIEYIYFNGAAYPNGIGYGNGSVLDNDEWFRGGMEVGITGRVHYQGASSLVPDSPLKIKMWSGTDLLSLSDLDADGDYRNTTISTTDGTFTIANDSVNGWTTPSTTGIDDPYYFTIEIFDNIGDFENNTHIDNSSSAECIIRTRRDNENPTLTDPFVSDFTSGDSDEIFGVASSNTLYFSDDFDSDGFVYFEAASGGDGSGSGVYGIDFGNLGPFNPTIDTDGSDGYWGGQYTINDATTTTTITVEIYDNVGNINSDTIFLNEDVTQPNIVLTGESEASPFLYAEYSDISEGIYGPGMGSTPHNYTISGNGSDVGGSGVKAVISSSAFGATPTNGGDAVNWNFTHSITSDYSVNVTVIYTLTDNVGNEQSISYTFKYDGTPPTVTDALSGYSEGVDYVEDVYGNTSSNTFYYSNSIPGTATVTFEATASDNLAGLRGIDFGVFGDDHPGEDTGFPYQGVYIITNSDSGSFINITAFDNVNNSASVIINCVEDVVGPTIALFGALESSPYLFANYGLLSEGVYGSGMGGVAQSYTISGSGSDPGGSGVSTVVDNTSFGGDPINVGSAAAWSFTYWIDAGDNGNVTVTYTLFDNVGNNNTCTYTFIEDNSSPTVIDAIFSYFEGPGDVGDVYCDIGTNTFYYSDSIPSSATITFNASASDDGVAGIRNVTFGAFGDDGPIEDNSFPYQGQYIITNADSGGSIVVTVYDNVNNSASATITCIEDTTAPTGYVLSLEPDTATNGKAPLVGYYDDDSINVTATENNSITESGSGLPIDCYSFTIGNRAWSTWSSSENFTFLSVVDGYYTTYVRLIDNVGNIGLNQTVTVIVDTQVPTITLTSTTNGSTLLYPGTIELDITDDNLLDSSYFWNSGANQSFTVQWNVSVLTVTGWQWLYVYSNDSAGNENLIGYYFYCVIDDSDPPKINHPDDLVYENGTLGNFLFWITNSTSPATYVLYWNKTVNETDTWDGSNLQFNVDGLVVGSHNYTLVVWDLIGNNATDTVWVTVLPSRPVIITRPMQLNAIEGLLFKFDFNASTSHVTSLVWTIFGNCTSWLVIDTNTGEVTGTFDYLCSEWWNVTVIVKDDNNLTSSCMVPLRVQEAVLLIVDDTDGEDIWLFDGVTVFLELQTAGGSPVSGLTVEWWLNGVLQGVNTTDASGFAYWSLNFDIIGDNNVTAQLSGRSIVRTEIWFVVKTLEFWFDGSNNGTEPVFIQQHDNYLLQGQLVDEAGHGIPGVPVSFMLNSSALDSNTTDSNGWIITSYPFHKIGTYFVTAVKGGHTLSLGAKQAELVIHVMATAPIVVQVTPENTTAETVINRPMEFVARVYFNESTDIGLPGASIDLIVNGAIVDSQVSDVDGFVTFSYTFVATGTYFVSFYYNDRSWGGVWVTATTGYFATFDGEIIINSTIGEAITFTIYVKTNNSESNSSLRFRLAADSNPVIGSDIDWYINDVHHETTTTGAEGRTSFTHTFSTINVYTITAKHAGQTLVTFTVTISDKPLPEIPVEAIGLLALILILAALIIVVAAVPAARHKVRNSFRWLRTRVKRGTLFTPTYYARELSPEVEESLGFKVLISASSNPENQKLVKREVSTKLLRFEEFTSRPVSERLKIVSQTTDRIISRYRDKEVDES